MPGQKRIVTAAANERQAAPLRTPLRFSVKKDRFALDEASNHPARTCQKVRPLGHAESPGRGH